MHIPDGLLSPTTCAVMYGASAPGWLVATRKIGREMQTRLLPQMALVAAFCFVLMMFNVPIMGGTSAHAVGMGLAAVTLGPWAAALAVSVALAIQALFFGDGGILTFGANAFNMAIVGSFVAYGAYRVVAGRSPLTSRRRAVAAGVGGYLGINLAALCAAVEFGIQPLFYHTANGTPLYAPYPLGVTLPAMLLPHLTLAGAAEALATTGIVVWLQKLDPGLLRRTAPPGVIVERAGLERGVGREEDESVATDRYRPLWVGLALLMIFSPLGLLASGGAWGEWSPRDFTNPATRQQIRASSGGHQVPVQPPACLRALAGHWHAPLPNYSASWASSPAAGYILSAFTGVGCIWLAFLALQALLRRHKAGLT